MLLVGFAYSKSNNDSTDFYLGGRKMGPLVTAMSAEASDMSSWLLMGMPGLAYLTGIASPGWTAIGLALGTWLNCSSWPGGCGGIRPIWKPSPCPSSCPCASTTSAICSTHWAR